MGAITDAFLAAGIRSRTLGTHLAVSSVRMTKSGVRPEAIICWIIARADGGSLAVASIESFLAMSCANSRSSGEIPAMRMIIGLGFALVIFLATFSTASAPESWRVWIVAEE